MYDDFDTQLQCEDVYTDEYAHYDDLFATVPVPMKVARSKPRNYHMATLKRVEGALNRYRNAGIL